MIFQFECAPYIRIGEGFPPAKLPKSDSRIFFRDGVEIEMREGPKWFGVALHYVTSLI